ncbi:GntR family transcriptional regulator [Sulfitobacter mediterraneus]|uniref:GntR family transcriptional regulator n=1 Tax=Sulfitobacter mediterraneus TaxID=83219 RepID=UPI0021A43355|nr:GntR family transcriptional regulator [Sulfitobacter mediterraneus]UWR13416.1 GntR family transcriptional regulator [Sulfitobacter mediterraneus]
MLYLDVAGKIRSEFSDGRFSPGALLPSENELVDAFDVSRTTIRKALRSLEDEGFLERRQGQGTFLCFGKYTRRVSSKLDFVSHGQRSGGRPTTKLLSRELRPKSIAEASLFDAPPNVQVFEIKRLRLLKGEVCVLQTSVLPITELDEYPPSDFENRSLYKILEQDFQIFVGPVKETLTCCNAPQDIAEVIGLEVGDAVFVSHRIVRNRTGQVVEISRNYIRSDRYCFVQDSSILGHSE